MTRLRKVMLEELQRRNFSSETIRAYIGAVERFARYFGKPPDQLGPDHIRQWQAHLLHERKLSVGTVVAQVAGLRFFFVRTLKRRFPPDSIPYPRYTHHRVPQVLSPEEVARLIDAASNLQARAILMTLYSTGVRRSELVRLRVQDIDSERMVVHIRKGKGGKDRDLPLCTKLLETLRRCTGAGRSRRPTCFPSSSGHRGSRAAYVGPRDLVRLCRSRSPCRFEETRCPSHVAA